MRCHIALQLSDHQSAVRVDGQHVEAVSNGIAFGGMPTVVLGRDDFDTRSEDLEGSPPVAD
jgi:hypothetical protein